MLSRALADALENNLIRENQMLNGRSEMEIMQDAKTNCALDLISNPQYAIDLSLRRKLSKEIDLTKDVRVRDSGGRGGSGAIAKAAIGGGWGEGTCDAVNHAGPLDVEGESKGWCSEG